MIELIEIDGRKFEIKTKFNISQFKPELVEGYKHRYNVDNFVQINENDILFLSEIFDVSEEPIESVVTNGVE